MCTLQGIIQAIYHFVASLVDQTLPFTQLLNKEVELKWNKDCKKYFESLKYYLTTPPILQPSMQDMVFILYIVVSAHALATFLAQQDNSGREHPIYFLSQTLIDYNTQYTMI